MSTTAYALADRSGLTSPFAALHHVALITNDMEKTVAFYRDVLGSEIAMAHRMPREGNERHYFITVAPNVVFAFFEFPNATLPEYQPETMPKTGRALDHVCFLVPDEAAFTAMYERVRGKVAYLSPMRDMGLARAFFFTDPNNIILEVMLEQNNALSTFPRLDDPDPAY